MAIRFARKIPKPLILDVTPMADMVLLLLIFFMLSSSFLIEPGVKVKLPKTKIAEIQAEEKMVISITKDKKIYLDNKLVRLDILEEILRTAYKHGKQLLIIRADEAVSYGTVVEVLDKAKLAGIERLAIATEKK